MDEIPLRLSARSSETLQMETVHNLIPNATCGLTSINRVLISNDRPKILSYGKEMFLTINYSVSYVQAFIDKKEKFLSEAFSEPDPQEISLPVVE